MQTFERLATGFELKKLGSRRPLSRIDKLTVSCLQLDQFRNHTPEIAPILPQRARLIERTLDAVRNLNDLVLKFVFLSLKGSKVTPRLSEDGLPLAMG